MTRRDIAPRPGRSARPGCGPPSPAVGCGCGCLLALLAALALLFLAANPRLG